MYPPIKKKATRSTHPIIPHIYRREEEGSNQQAHTNNSFKRGVHTKQGMVGALVIIPNVHQQHTDTQGAIDQCPPEEEPACTAAEEPAAS